MPEAVHGSGSENGAPRREETLRQELLDSVESLRPDSDKVAMLASRRHQVLRLRYVEGLDAQTEEVAQAMRRVETGESGATPFSSR